MCLVQGEERVAIIPAPMFTFLETNPGAAASWPASAAQRAVRAWETHTCGGLGDRPRSIPGTSNQNTHLSLLTSWSQLQR